MTRLISPVPGAHGMTTMIDIEARGTQHCETSALGVLLRHQGLDLSEPMLAVQALIRPGNETSA